MTSALLGGDRGLLIISFPAGLRLGVGDVAGEFGRDGAGLDHESRGRRVRVLDAGMLASR
jgi:hypothetical protein